LFRLVNENEYARVIEEYVTMSDGVRLYTRVTMPKGKEKCPVVFVRTPYDEPLGGKSYDINEVEKCNFVKNGYAVVRQHCRGTGDSEGDFMPYVERNDGLETLDYIRSLPFYNGEIYLWGRSYLTTVHLCYLSAKPKDIKGAAFEIQTDRMFFRNYRNGCCYDLCFVGWWLNRLRRRFPEQNREEIFKRPYKDLMKRVLGVDLPNYTKHLTNDTYNEFWTSDPRTFVVDDLEIPVIFIDGWYDFYTQGMFSMWERLPSETKKKSAFVVGPWGHDTKVKEDTEYPLTNGNIPEDYAAQWFDSIRDNRKYEHAEYGKVNYYSIGADEWGTAEYPLKQADTKRLYFNGDNKLCKTCGEGSFTYEYDPEKRLGAFKYMNIHKAEEINAIDGIISFVSDAFEEDESFFGEIGWHMNVASDCEDSAFYIRIYLEENGEAFNLTETITSINNINKEYKPNDRIIIDIKTPPIGFTVKKGNKIRVDIASDGGVYIPNANVKGHWAEITETKVAKNTIFCDDAYIELPKTNFNHKETTSE